MLRTAVLSLLVAATFGADWNYDRCDKSKGPAAWSGACKTGSAQTPINLCSGIAFSGTAPTLTFTGYNTQRAVKLLNTGYALQIDMSDTTATVNARNLAQIVGHTSSSATPNWILGQMHLHYGRTGKLDEGSEHYLQGKAYPAEAHFVHYNSEFSSVSTAVQSGRGDALLVVGIFLEVQSSNADVLTAMANGAATATKTATTMSGTYAMNTLVDNVGDWYSYRGGLTTPTCNEQVTWIVFKTPKGITADNLAKFKAATTTPAASSFTKFALQATGEVQGKFGTYRPLQPANGRKIYYTGGNTTACTMVTEPVFTCSSGLLTQPSLLVALLAFCLVYNQQ